jgi:hypothetical protein
MGLPGEVMMEHSGMLSLRGSMIPAVPIEIDQGKVGGRGISIDETSPGTFQHVHKGNLRVVAIPVT